MSVEAIALALHHSRAKGAAKLVLLGIANHDGDGGAWPSMATLARYAGVTPDQARKLVKKLTELGEVRVLRQEGGMPFTPDHLRPNLYQFQVRCPPDCDRTTRHRNRSQLLPEMPVDNLWIDPPAAPLAPIRGTAASRAEPSLRTNYLNERTNVPNRARASAASSHTDARSGRPCPGRILEDGRHCELGCLIETTTGDTSAD